MKIIIVGIGKVGYAIAEQMTGENHDLVVIDPTAPCSTMWTPCSM